MSTETTTICPMPTWECNLLNHYCTQQPPKQGHKGAMMTRITSYGEREMTIIERLNTRLICAFLDHNFYVCRIGRDVDNWVQCERCKHVVPRMSIESYLRTRYSLWRDRHFTKSA